MINLGSAHGTRKVERQAMTCNWGALLVAQLEFYWDVHLRPRLEGLTDEEYFWEPVEGCWSLRRGEDGRYALDVCMRSMPDLVLLDWHLPVMDGLDFLQKLRQMDGGKQPKVVFCASEADVAQIARALRAGADEYLLKPFDRATVETKLHEVGML